MHKGTHERAGAPLQTADSKPSLLSRICSWIAPEPLAGQGNQNLPGSLAQSRQRSLVNLEALGVTLVRCDENRLDAEPSKHVFDHPWSFLRIRLTGTATESFLDGAMKLSERLVPRLQLIKATEFVGCTSSPNEAWVLIVRGRATKRAGRLGCVHEGQASYLEEVPWTGEANAAQPKIVVDE